MKVNTVIRTEQGLVKFQGELNQEESDMVVQIGLNVILQMGGFPASDEAGPPPTIVEGNDTLN